jgi:hypothetical protein
VPIFGNRTDKPILAVDVDGVISLFGFQEGYGLASGDAPFGDCPPGSLHSINGVMHYIASECGGRLLRLAEHFELVWATGWEETANDYLPHLLRLPGRLPYLTFDGRVAAGSAHWKVDAIAEYAGDRPLAWIDDNLDEHCHAWAASRPAPTLLVETEPSRGLEEAHVDALIAWQNAGFRPR